MIGELSDGKRTNDIGHDLLPPRGATEPAHAPDEQSQVECDWSDTEMTEVEFDWSDTEMSEDTDKDKGGESATLRYAVKTRYATTGSAMLYNYKAPVDVKHYNFSSSDTEADGEEHNGVVKKVKTYLQRPCDEEHPSDDRWQRREQATKKTKQRPEAHESKTSLASKLLTIEDAKRVLRDRYDQMRRGQILTKPTFRDPNIHPSEFRDKTSCPASRETVTQLQRRIARSPPFSSPHSSYPMEQFVLRQAMTLNEFWRMRWATDWHTQESIPETPPAEHRLRQLSTGAIEPSKGEDSAGSNRWWPCESNSEASITNKQVGTSTQAQPNGVQEQSEPPRGFSALLPSQRSSELIDIFITNLAGTATRMSLPMNPA